MPGDPAGTGSPALDAQVRRLGTLVGFGRVSWRVLIRQQNVQEMSKSERNALSELEPLSTRLACDAAPRANFGHLPSAASIPRPALRRQRSHVRIVPGALLSCGGLT